MTMIKLPLIGLLFSLGICSPQIVPQEENIPGIKLPEGFSISYYAKDVKNARSMALSETGVLFVGTRKEGKVYALVDGNKDFKADKKYVIASDLNMPNGVALKNGDLYVAEVDKIWRYKDIEKNLENPPKPELVTDRYPSDDHHGWKYIAFGPDGKLYVPVGAPCNICEEKNPVYASITSFDVEEKKMEVVASGVRNTVGFTWHPETKKMWFTDNGRDWSGDDIPPDELNRLDKPGQHFGFPFCHGENHLDNEYGKNKKCGDYTAPVRHLGPHVAALGIKFPSVKMFPEKYRNGVFIAEHGSWNRSEPIGYRVTFVKLEGEKAISYETFAEGWLKGKKAWGRPVDLIFLSDGSMLVSDDHGDAIYRITYSGK